MTTLKSALHQRGMFILALLAATITLWSKKANAQNTEKTEKSEVASIIWINSFYGPNNFGVGLGARYSAIGIGATVFGFAGDTTHGLSARPGMIGVSIDLYIGIDFNTWLAAYGNIGAVARLATYKAQEDVAKTYVKHAMMSVGGGFQVSLASRLTIGIGYNALLDLPDYEGGPTYNVLHSIVPQIGYRL